jgi:hypothetical protein
MTGFDPAGGCTVRVAIIAAIEQPTASANTQMCGARAPGAATALKEFSHARVGVEPGEVLKPCTHRGLRISSHDEHARITRF